jgi:hypothetical protein
MGLKAGPSVHVEDFFPLLKVTVFNKVLGYRLGNVEGGL